jgi:hypothetical protein
MPDQQGPKAPEFACAGTIPSASSGCFIMRLIFCAAVFRWLLRALQAFTRSVPAGTGLFIPGKEIYAADKECDNYT